MRRLRRTKKVIAIESCHGRSIEDLIKELYNQPGATQESVARSLGVHHLTVQRWMALIGIPARQAWQQPDEQAATLDPAVNR